MRLTDEFGNDYLRVHRKMRIPGGQLDGYPVDWVRLIGSTNGEILYPGQSVTDLFAFERPVDKAKKLHLELPGENCGLDQPFPLKIDLNPPPEPTAADLAKAQKQAEVDEPALEVGPDRPAEVRKAAEALTRLRRARVVLSRFPNSAQARQNEEAAVAAGVKAAAELKKAKAGGNGSRSGGGTGPSRPKVPHLEDGLGAGPDQVPDVKRKVKEGIGGGWPLEGRG